MPADLLPVVGDRVQAARELLARRDERAYYTGHKDPDMAEALRDVLAVLDKVLTTPLGTLSPGLVLDNINTTLETP